MISLKKTLMLAYSSRTSQRFGSVQLKEGQQEWEDLRIFQEHDHELRGAAYHGCGIEGWLNRSSLNNDGNSISLTSRSIWIEKRNNPQTGKRFGYHMDSIVNEQKSLASTMRR